MKAKFRIAISQSSDSVPGGSGDMGDLWVDKASIQLGVRAVATPAETAEPTQTQTRRSAKKPPRLFHPRWVSSRPAANSEERTLRQSSDYPLVVTRTSVHCPCQAGRVNAWRIRGPITVVSRLPRLVGLFSQCLLRTPVTLYCASNDEQGREEVPGRPLRPYKISYGRPCKPYVMCPRGETLDPDN